MRPLWIGWREQGSREAALAPPFLNLEANTSTHVQGGFSPEEAESRRRQLRDAVAVWMLWATIMLVAIAVGGRVRPVPVVPPVEPGEEMFWPLFRWDYNAYQEIARQGYPPYPHISYAWFPLWPMLLRASNLIGGPTLWGIVLAVFASAAAFIGTAVTDPSGEIRRSAVALACMPGSFALILVYPDALALAAAAWACVAAARNRWIVSATLGLLVAVTRPNGFLVVIPLLAFAARSRRRSRYLALMAPVAGLAGVLIYFWFRSGTPFAFTRAQSIWNRSGPWNLPSSVASGPTHVPDTVIAAFAIALCVILWRKLLIHRSWATYATAVLLVSLGSGSVFSIGRQMLFGFPLVWAAADGPALLRRPPVAALGFLMSVGHAVLLYRVFP